MAEKRMFSKTIIDSDAFLDMPQSSQLLYFHLALRADDDGFVNNPKSIMRNVRCNDDDMKVLMTKKFIIPFPSGVIVIKHWKIHNYIAKDRYKPTKYIDEMSNLVIDENKAYKTLDTDCIQDVYNMDTQISIDKNRLDKISIDKDIHNTQKSNHLNVPKKNTKHKYGEFNNVLLTDKEKEKLNDEFGEPFANECIKTLDEAIEMKGYKYKSHYLAIRKWVVDAVKDRGIVPKKHERSVVYEPISRQEDDICF